MRENWMHLDCNWDTCAFTFKEVYRPINKQAYLGDNVCILSMLLWAAGVLPFSSQEWNRSSRCTVLRENETRRNPKNNSLAPGDYVNVLCGYQLDGVPTYQTTSLKLPKLWKSWRSSHQTTEIDGLAGGRAIRENENERLAPFVPFYHCKRPKWHKVGPFRGPTLATLASFRSFIAT